MGQVGARMSSIFTLGSTYDTILCHLCPNVRASAYCVDCQIYLCPNCKDQHKKYPAFKDHQLLEGKKMPLLNAAGHMARTNDLDYGSDSISSTDSVSSTSSTSTTPGNSMSSLANVKLPGLVFTEVIKNNCFFSRFIKCLLNTLRELPCSLVV